MQDKIESVPSELKRYNKFLAKFPEHLGIPAWTIKKVSNPIYNGNEWENIEFSFDDPIGNSASERLFKLISFAKRQKFEGNLILFIVKMELLDPCDFIVETWDIAVSDIIKVDFGGFDYKNSNTREPKLVLKPYAVTFSV